jgi:hypothetical protein
MRFALVCWTALALAACGDNEKSACKVDSDCTGSICNAYACVGGTCEPAPIRAGGYAPVQVPGDCHIAICDGNGGVQQMVDDSDMPATPGPCVLAACTNGTPSTTYAQADTACGSGLVCDTVGQCVGCIGPIQCPGSDTQCEARTCINNTCGLVYTTAGTLLTTQTKGDCEDVVCDGSGGTTKVPDNNDVPPTTNVCIAEGCSAGAPSSSPKPAGTTCGSASGSAEVCDGSGHCTACNVGTDCPGSDTACATRTCTNHVCGVSDAASGTTCNTNEVCDGAGNCNPCNVSTDCPGSDTACATRTCTNHTCGVSAAAAGTVTPNQVVGTCQQTQCDGAGNTKQVEDDQNLPTTTNVCLQAVCTAGVPSNPPQPVGTSCGGADECDGAGDCVGCVKDSDCGTNTDCVSFACVMSVCNTTFTAQGTPTTSQTSGTCQQIQCNGTGGTQSVEFDSNVPPSTSCITGVCTNGAPGFVDLPQGTSCGATVECDGNGNCTTFCGNGIADGTEQCDTNDLRGQTCVLLGFQTGTLACNANCTYNETGCSTCGDGIISGTEVCDGSNLGSATCGSEDEAPGTLACSSSCTSFDTTQCTGGWITANTNFNGTVCIDGLLYDAPGDLLAVCTSDDGIWRGQVDNGSLPIDDPSWVNADGSNAGSDVTSLLGVGVAVFGLNGGIKFWTSNTTGTNFWANSNANFSATPPTWNGGTNQQAFTQQIVAVLPGSSNNNYLAGWDPVSGEALVLHGNTLTAACTANGQLGCSFPVLITGATGVVTSVTSGQDNPVQTTDDIHVVVSGTTGSGSAATGAGIYWSCNSGASYVEDDNGIAANDKPLLWKVVADRASFSTQSTARTCPTTGGSVTQYASVMYAALLGGGSIYKTTDGGATWALSNGTPSNNHLPANVEVFSIAIDCGQTTLGKVLNTCINDQLVYAATSQGVYKSTDGGATWTLDGLKGSFVHAVSIKTAHPQAVIAASPTGATEATDANGNNIATFTLTSQVFTINVGDKIVITQLPVAGYNGTWTVASVISATQFTVTLPAAATGLAATGGGNAIQFIPRVFAATDQLDGVFQTNVPVVP